MPAHPVLHVHAAPEAAVGSAVMPHWRQSAAAVEPVDAVYVPVPQAVHMAAVVLAVYEPAAHAVHAAVLPPAL